MNLDESQTTCSALKSALELIGDRWSMIILWNVKEKPMRFGDLQKASEGVNTRTLTQRLQKLEEFGLVTKREYKEYPPRTEYEITDKGRELEPVFLSLTDWARDHLAQK